MKVVVNNVEKIVVAGMVLLLVLVTSGGLARAGQSGFQDTPSVMKFRASEIILSQDGGDSWTGNLLDPSTTLDIVSVGVGEKVGDFILGKALPTGHYNRLRATSTGSIFLIKGIVAVDPDEIGWGGTWPGGGTETRYYYTNAAGTGTTYQSSRAAAEAAGDYAEMEYLLGPGNVFETVIDIDISEGETTTLRLWVGLLLQYIAEYDGGKIFTGGEFHPGGDVRVE